MAACPKCGKDNTVPAKEWVGGRNAKKPMTVRRFVCAECGTSYVAWLDAKTGKTKTMARERRA